MSLSLKELKDMHEKGYNYGYENRLKAADDLMFYWVTHWDDQMLSASPLAYRGQFDVLRKAGRQIIGDLRSNEISIDFEPTDESRVDGADLIDGMYRSDDRRNSTIEAYDYAQQEQVVSGVGAWELFTDYISNRAGFDQQVIKRRYIPEANNTVFWDPNAKALDKSDARYCSVLTAYSEQGYKDLREELGLEEVNIVPSNFSDPEQSYTFPWLITDKKLYVTTFYYCHKVKDVIYTLESPVGETILQRKSDLERNDVLDDLADAGYNIVDERNIERWAVTQYIASGMEILSEVEIANEHIPVVPCYGERAFVEGVEVYEGVTRLAKDPQRLRDFQLSYLTDIVSRSPRPKPIFNPEQIQGFEDMYDESGADNNYPYLLANRYDANGQPLPLGPVAMMPEQPIPSALIASIELSRQAVEDVANPGVPQDIADPDTSGKAVLALQNRLDQQSIVYQQNFKHAKRRDAEVYASFASNIYDTPRDVTITKPDGSRERVKIMEAVIDKETGAPVVLNDLTNSEFDVFATISRSYTTKKQETIENIDNTIVQLPPGDPMQMALILKKMALMEGVEFDDIREYSNKQLILRGFKEPETDEEKQMMQQAAQQQQQPDAAMELAKAEQMKGQAQMMKAQNEGIKAQAQIQNEQIKTQIDGFEAQTGRINAQVDAQKAGAEINYKQVDTLGKQIDNAMKLRGAAVPARQMYQ